MSEKNEILKMERILEEIHAFTMEPGSSSLDDRFRSKYVFRGMQNSQYTLKNGLMRLNLKLEEDKKYDIEYHLLRNFRKYSALEYNNNDDISLWKLISLAQHHRLPTRLLDWTFSPLIALHFATLEDYTTDGAIWCVDFTKVLKKESNLPYAFSRQQSWVKSTVFSTRMLDNMIKETTEEGKNNSDIPDISIKRQLAVISEQKGYLSNYNKTNNSQDKKVRNDYAVFFEPPSIDSRIINQYSLFSFLSDPFMDFNKWLSELQDTTGDKSIYTKIPIPHNLKWRLRNFLDQSNITERVLFPGLDGLAQWLTRHYSPAP